MISLKSLFFDNKRKTKIFESFEYIFIPSVSLKDQITFFMSFKTLINVIHCNGIELIGYTLSPFDTMRRIFLLIETANSSVMKRCYRI